MTRHTLTGDPSPDQVTGLTLVLFMPNGDCAVIAGERGGSALPSGDLLPGEHFRDAAVRIPLETAGFRIQRFHPFALDGTHLYAWAEGDRYGPGGSREYREVVLVVAPAGEIVQGFRAAGREDEAGLVEEAARSFRTQTDESYYADNLRMLERAYLRATTPEGGSGFGRDAAAWRKAWEMIVDGMDRDGTFLDVGCANGLLMESVVRWAAERGLRIEPYGVDLAPGLIALARRGLPQWADRIWVGNAIDWLPPDGRRFDFVHTLLECVPPARRRSMLEHQLRHLVAPGGRLLISQYFGSGESMRPSTAKVLRDLEFEVEGESRPSEPAFANRASTAWIAAHALIRERH